MGQHFQQLLEVVEEEKDLAPLVRLKPEAFCEIGLLLGHNRGGGLRGVRREVCLNNDSKELTFMLYAHPRFILHANLRKALYFQFQYHFAVCSSHCQYLFCACANRASTSQNAFTASNDD